MSTVRPIVTIAILIAVGAFLYVKINEGPAAAVPGAAQDSPSDAISGVPPLAATSGTSTPSAATTAAPLWPAASTGPTGANAQSNDASFPPLSNISPPIADVATANDAANNFPAAPAIPELPPVAATGGTMLAGPAGSNPFDEIATGTAQPNANDATPQPTATSPLQGNIVGGASTAPYAEAITGTMPTDATTAAPYPNAQTTAAQNPLRPSAPAENAADRYGSSIYAQQPLATADAPVEPSFAASWPAIQTALDQGKLSVAHELLTKWYNEPSLTTAEAEKVESLLSQLAGTVIYSSEHQLLPAHVVKPGETLEIIGKGYNVPWQLLAKINGIASANQLRPGQELKVLQGPFAAVVDLGRSELALQINGRYAGKFRVTIPVGTAISEGEWLVDQKLVAPGNVAQASYTTQPSTVDHAIVLRSETSAGLTGGGPTLAIASSSTPTAPGASPAAIQLTAADAEELSDILSIGSRVVIRR